MKKTNALITLLFSLLIGIEMCSATTIDTYQFCRGMTPPEGDDYSKPIECIEQATEFVTTDTAVYIIIKLSSLVQDDEVDYKVSNPSGTVIDEDSLIILQNTDVWYDYREIRIADQNLQPGEYTVKINIKSNGISSEVVSDKFTIIEDVSDMCEPQGLYCCPSTKVCLSAQDGICDSGACCESEAKCVTYSSNYFSRREVTNCEAERLENGESLKDCRKVLRLYEYNLHGRIEPPQTGVIYFRGIDVDCTDKKDVAIAYYDEGTSTWIEKVTKVEKTDASGSYKATALLDHLGYIALVRTSQCVPMPCTYGGYRTTPVGGYVNFEEPITFKLCGMINGCDATKDGTCNKKCSDSVDLDCTECTSQKGDCCLVSYDGICDLDCGPDMDPDCCVKPNKLCCPGDESSSGYSGCDKNCDTSDTQCSGCTSSGGDCCNPASDGTCDPDCPKLSNGVGYLDPDCCNDNEKDIAITSKYGDCCNDARDDACDFDCIAGVDLDCIFTSGYCGDRKCSGGEDPSNCPTDCYCGDHICSTGENCANCEADCGKCCGNGVCDYGEDSETCPTDCPPVEDYYTGGW